MRARPGSRAPARVVPSTGRLWSERRVLRQESRVEKFDGPAIEPIELLSIRIRVEILSESRKFCQNSSEIQKFEDLSTFSKLFIEILINFHWNWCKSRWTLLKNRDFCRDHLSKNMKKFDKNLRRFWVSSGAKVWESCRSRKTLQNKYLDAKIGVDTAENEPSKVWWFGWKIWEKFGIELFN